MARHTNRVVEVNSALAALGVAERLRAGRGYYYFAGGNAAIWPSSSVYVYRSDEMTVEEWIREFEALRGATRVR